MSPLAHAVRTSFVASLCGLVCLGALACGSDDKDKGPAANGGSGGGAGMLARAGTGGAGTSGSVAQAGRAAAGAGGVSAPGGSGGSAGASGRGQAAGGASGAAAGSGALVNPAPGSKFFVGANFWNVDWEGSDDYFQKNVDWSTTKDPWNPQLIKDLAPYHVLRFMDWNLINEKTNAQANWDTRTKATDKQTELIAFEWQIDLCNRSLKDYWVNVPSQANLDYMSKLATLIHDQLDPSLRVYVEWSNEVWNPGFPQRQYAQQQGQMLNLSGDKADSYHVYQSVRMFEAFEAVFGKGSPRVVKVLAGQAAGTNHCTNHVAALKDKTINPNATQPSVYAVAPYFKGNTIDELMNSGIPEAKGWIDDSYKCANGAGWPLIAYEGGQDSYAAGEQACATVQRNAAMHDVYTKFLDAMVGAKLSGPFTQYTHSGNCWGLKQKTSDAAADSPKYQGVLDWLSAHP